MTLTWRTLRDYALRFVTFVAVSVSAVSIPIPLIVSAVYLMRFYWLSWTVSHADILAWTALVVWFTLIFLLASVGHRWRKDWLWRRWWIDVGH